MCVKQHTHGRMEDTGEGSLRVTTDHVAPPSVSSKNLARVPSAVTDTYYLLCCLIPTARDTETQRGLVTNLRTHSRHPGGRRAENPQPMPSAVLSPGCPPHAGLVGRVTEQHDKDQDPTQRPKMGLSDSSRTQTPELALLGHLSLLAEVGVVSGPNEK